MSKNIETFSGARQTIDDCLCRFRQHPDETRHREIVIYCTYSSLDDYYIGCGWRFVGEKNSCTVYYILTNEMCYNFTEQMYKDIQIELEHQIKEALVAHRMKELERDFENGN